MFLNLRNRWRTFLYLLEGAFETIAREEDRATEEPRDAWEVIHGGTSWRLW